MVLGLAGAVLAAGGLVGAGLAVVEAGDGSQALAAPVSAGAPTAAGTVATTDSAAITQTGTLTRAGSAKRGYKCFKADRYHVFNDRQNIKVYEWHGVIQYCANGKRVKGGSVSHYLKLKRPYALWDISFKKSSKYNKSRSKWYVTLKGKVERSGNPDIYDTPKISFTVRAKDGRYTVTFDR